MRLGDISLFARLPDALCPRACPADFTFTDIGRELGRMWSELSDKDKKVRFSRFPFEFPRACDTDGVFRRVSVPHPCPQPYQAQADADKARYARELAAAGKE